MIAKQNDVVIVGGGLAGLTAAVKLGRAGKRVVLCEKARRLGGRAQTLEREGFLWNMGGHAFYGGGAGMRILRQLGIEVRGGKPSSSIHALVAGGACHVMPLGSPFLNRSLMGWAERWGLLRGFVALMRSAPEVWQERSWEDWLSLHSQNPVVRQILASFGRLVSYCHAPASTSAGSILKQFRIAMRHGVFYLDGGFQSLVDQLVAEAEAVGVVFHHARRVKKVLGRETVEGVLFDDGSALQAKDVILTVPPTEAARLLDEESATQSRLTQTTPVEVACLDLALSELPKPSIGVALGLDEPMYYSVHSRYAKLGERAGAVLHLMYYREPGQHYDPKALERSLQSFLSLIQPGWQERVLFQRFLPKMVATHALSEAHHGGNAGRPAHRCATTQGLWFAGDWVACGSALADAAIESGADVATAILQAGALVQRERLSVAAMV